MLCRVKARSLASSEAVFAGAVGVKVAPRSTRRSRTRRCRWYRWLFDCGHLAVGVPLACVPGHEYGTADLPFGDFLVVAAAGDRELSIGAADRLRRYCPAG